MSKIAILTPCYDESEHLIWRNIKSVGNQKTQHEILHIMVCDKPDRVLPETITKGYSGHGYTRVYIQHTENQGLSSARNTALRAGKDCDFFMLLDIDDAFVHGRVEKQIKFMQENRLDHCFGGLQEWHGNNPEPSAGVSIPAEFDLLELLKGHNMCYCGSNCFSRAVYEDVGDFDEELNRLGAEDLDYWIRVGLAGYRSKLLPEVLYYQGIHEGNMTARYLADGQFAKAYEYLKNKYPGQFSGRI